MPLPTTSGGSTGIVQPVKERKVGSLPEAGQANRPAGADALLGGCTRFEVLGRVDSNHQPLD